MKRWITAPLLLTLAVLVVGELIVRVFYTRSMSGRFEYGYNPTSGFEEKADGAVHLVRAGGRRFRPQSFMSVRPEGKFRVMVIGDSVPRGSSLETAYPYRLGELLRAQGVAAETFNLGVAGYGVRRSQIVLQQALKYQPSLVVLHLNNSNEFEDERDWQRAEALRGWHPRNWPMKSFLIARLYEMKTERIFWLWLPNEVRNRTARNDAGDELAANRDPARVRAWQQRIHDTVRESVALAERAGVPLLIVTQARVEPQANGSDELKDYGLDELAQALQGPKVFIVSMKDTFSIGDSAKWFADGSHLRPEGHEKLAQAIVQELKSRQTIP